jgi:hypothetical protein
MSHDTPDRKFVKNTASRLIGRLAINSALFDEYIYENSAETENTANAALKTAVNICEFKRSAAA